MPKAGFKTITLKKSTYKALNDWYEERRFNLSAFGINSLSGLATTILISAKNKDGEHLTKIMETGIDRK